MKEWIELYDTQNINDLVFGHKCKDELVETLSPLVDLGQDYYNKAEELFSLDKAKAFEYYKLAYKNNFWLAPYMLGIYFEYGVGEYVQSSFIAFDFYKEAINRDDARGYTQLAEIIVQTDKKLLLWNKFFQSDFLKEVDLSLGDFANYNIDYRAVFLYKFRNEISYENEIREIISIIKPSLIKDYDNIIFTLNNLLEGEISDVEEEVFNDIIYVVNLVKNSNEEELFISGEDMGIKLEKLLKKDKKWD